MIGRHLDAALRAVGALTLMRIRDRHRDGMLRVLLYHRVCDPARGVFGDPNVLSATPSAFDAQMAYVARQYVPVTAGQAADALRGEAPLPARAVLVTFDDGYRDFLSDAWPILRRHRVPALLFVPTAFPGTSRGFWWDELHEMVVRATVPEIRLSGLGVFLLRTDHERRMAVRTLNHVLKQLAPQTLSATVRELREALRAPERGGCPILTWDELRTLVAEGLAVGSHTRSHAAVPALTTEQIVDEVCRAHADLQRELGGVSPFFSYPYGSFDPRPVPTLRSLGYVAAFTALPGRNHVNHGDRFRLFRHAVNVQHSFAKFELSLTTTYAGVREYARWARTHLRLGVSR